MRSRPRWRFGVHFDVYFNERTCTSAGRVERALAGCAPGPRLRVRGRGLAAHHRLRRRPGPGAGARVPARWTYFAADCAYYLDKRGRGFDRCVYHARRRPPRLHRADAGDGRLLRRRPGRAPGDPDRAAGQPGPRRGAGADVASGPATSSPWRTWSTRSGWTPRGTRWPATPPTRRSTSTWRCGPGRTRQSGLLRAVRARPDRRLLRNAAELGVDRGERRLRPRPARAPKEHELLTALGEFPQVVATAAELREPHRVARYWRSWPARTTASTTPAGCCRRATSGRPTCTGPGCGWWRRPGWCSPTGWTCWASPLRSGCDGRAHAGT